MGVLVPTRCRNAIEWYEVLFGSSTRCSYCTGRQDQCLDSITVAARAAPVSEVMFRTPAREQQYPAKSRPVPQPPCENSSQELPPDAAELLKMGVGINACSLSQLRRIAEEAPGSSVGVRFNPGLGSGGTKSTNVGGPSSSFGEW